jgi:predicted MFS family arabinose efflux permease
VQAALAEQALNNQGQGTIADCFKEKTWRRTLVAVSVFFIQNACGTAWVVGYMSYFMQIAGMSAARSFDITVGICGLMIVGNACGGFFIERIGRRGTALYGTSALFVTLLLIGILAVVDSQGALVAQVVLMGVWAFRELPLTQFILALGTRLTSLHSIPRHNRQRRLAHQR